MHIQLDITHCPVCCGTLSTKKIKKGIFYHTALGTKKVSCTMLRCQHKMLDGSLCNTSISFNYYIHDSTQHYFTSSQPKYILVGETHFFDIHYVKMLATSQLLHGNGTNLLAIQVEICNQHPSTQNISTSIHGTKKLSPSVSPDTVATVIKLWHLLRYLGTHKPSPPSSFPVKWSLENIITWLQYDLKKFCLRKHAPASDYGCRSDIYVLDGTQKVTFKVFKVDGCLKPTGFKSSICLDHASYKDDHHEVYTGINEFLNLIYLTSFRRLV